MASEAAQLKVIEAARGLIAVAFSDPESTSSQKMDAFLALTAALRCLDSTETKYLIHSRYHQRGDSAVWWGIDRLGYVTALERAGRYTLAEAIEIVGRSKVESRSAAYLESDVIPLAFE